MQIFKAELKSWMLGEFASLKSKHDGGVAEANQQNLLNVIANKVKQSFWHCHCEPKARQTFQLHNNRLPRRYAPRNDDGRSMIEMLGVLAIIGVLSVGGIAGYSKAMMMWHSNVQRNMLAELISGVISLKSNFYKDNDLTTNEIDLTPTFAAMGMLPEGTKYFNSRIQDKYGIRVNIARTPTSWNNKGATISGRVFVMRLYYVPTDGAGVTSYQELCRNVVRVTKPLANEIGELRSWVSDHQNAGMKVIYYGWNLPEETVAETNQKCKDVAFGVHMTIVFNF